MQALPSELKCAEVTGKIIGIFYDVYNELGYGFLESVYEESMVIALRQAGLTVNRQERKKIRENPCKSVARISA